MTAGRMRPLHIVGSGTTVRAQRDAILFRNFVDGISETQPADSRPVSVPELEPKLSTSIPSCWSMLT